MGRLFLFNRKLDVATDDIGHPILYLLMSHLIWLPCIAYTLSLAITCQSSTATIGYLSAYMLQLVSLSATEIVLFCLSRMGTIADPGPRRYIGYMFHLEIQSLITEMIFHLYGLSVSFHLGYSENIGECLEKGSRMATIIRIVTLWGLVTSMAVLLTIVLLLNVSLGSKSVQKQGYFGFWKSRLEWLLLGWTRPRVSSATFAVASKLSESFTEEDWATSDLVAGLVLIQRRQELVKHVQELKEANQKDFGEETIVIQDSSIPEESDLQSDMWRIAREPVLPEDLQEMKDFGFYAQLANGNDSIQKLGSDHLIFTEIKDVSLQEPYLLLVSVTKKVIVLAVCGSISGVDTMFDLNMDMAPLEEVDGKMIEVNAGILQKAKDVYAHVLKLGIFARLLNDVNFKDYKIVVTGRSMGAVSCLLLFDPQGVAAVLAFLLRRAHGSKDIKCIAYSPPGMLISEAGGDDLFSRLSRNALSHLHRQITHQLQSCHLSKSFLLSQSQSVQESLKMPFGKGNLEKIYKSSPVHDKERVLATQFLPGRILFVGKSRISWRHPLEFQEIQISDSLLSDHSSIGIS